MADLPSISGKKVRRAFKKIGFEVDRKRGDHHILKKPGHRYVLSVPDHNSVKKGTLRALIKAAGLTEQEFIDLL